MLAQIGAATVTAKANGAEAAALDFEGPEEELQLTTRRRVEALARHHQVEDEHDLSAQGAPSKVDIASWRGIVNRRLTMKPQ
jgi:hypothetical protein